jgi:chorismate synthase
VLLRPLASPAEFEAAEDVQILAWGIRVGRGITPKDVMIAMHNNGGLALGAFDGRKLVGFSVMMPGYLEGTKYLYSHETGVIPEYQSKGIGYLLKQKQREVALARGFTLIAWTFDPIIASNAYFNLQKLGAIARTYHVDYYGSMPDSINYGWPTDRLVCEWFVDPKDQAMIRRYAEEVANAFSAVKKGGSEPYPVCVDWSIDLEAKRVLVHIPRQILKLKKKSASEAKRWRLATREVFKAYFAAGYSAVSVVRREDNVQYVLAKAQLPRNIFAG